jgi:hypothetical protein
MIPANQFNNTYPNPNAIQFWPTNSEGNDWCKKRQYALCNSSQPIWKTIIHNQKQHHQKKYNHKNIKSGITQKMSSTAASSKEASTKTASSKATSQQNQPIHLFDQVWF